MRTITAAVAAALTITCAACGSASHQAAAPPRPALRCPAQLSAWKPGAEHTLNGITEFTGKAERAENAAQAASAISAQLKDDTQADIYMTFVGSIAKVALEDLPPACSPQLRTSYRAAMSDYVQASQDVTNDDTQAATTALLAATQAENQASAALTNGGS